MEGNDLSNLAIFFFHPNIVEITQTLETLDIALDEAWVKYASSLRFDVGSDDLTGDPAVSADVYGFDNRSRNLRCQGLNGSADCNASDSHTPH